MRRTLPLLLVTVPLLSLAACTSVAPMQVRRFEARTPAPAPAESRSVLFSKLVSRMPPGRQIGTVQTGIACIGTRKMFEQSNGIDLRDPGLINAVNEELQKAGYRALGASSSLFGRTEEWQAELLLAGAMKELSGNGCFPRAAFGDMTVSTGEVSMEIEWQLFDRRSQSVVLSLTTGGTAQRSAMPDGLRQAYVGAVAASLHNLLAEPRAVAALTRPAAVSASPRSAISVPVIALEESAPASSDLIAYARGAVVTIPVGTGHGSGFVISRSGLVLTNAHVVGEGTSTLKVDLPGGRRVRGEVLRVDNTTDVALIQLESSEYAAIPVGASIGLKVGDPVFAIGTPLGQQWNRTVTKGVISSIRGDDGRRTIQSDAAIHAGSSGGPLLDDHGRVIGLAQSGLALGGGIGVGLNNFVPIEEVWRALGVAPETTTVSAGDLTTPKTQR